MGIVRFQRIVLFAVALCAVCSLATAQFQLRTPVVALNPPTLPFNAAEWNPSVAGDGAGNWVAVWGSMLIGGSHILAVRSADNGATWSTEVRLDPDVAELDGFIQTMPATIVTDGLGVWITIWSMDLNGGTSDRYTFVSRSTDNGASWTDPVALNSPAQTASPFNHPHIATDRAGNWVAIFLGEPATTPSTEDLYFARSSDNGLTWSAAAVLDDNPAHNLFEVYPSVAADEDGNWIVVWSTPNLDNDNPRDAYQIVAARSTDDGATWSDPAFVSTKIDDDTRPQIATDGADNWVVVWACGHGQPNETSFLVSRSTDDGNTWAPSMPVGPLGMSGVDSFLTTDRAGNWIATWQVEGNVIPTSNSFNAVSRSSDNGATWTTPEPLANNSTGQRAWLASDGAGSWIAMWTHSAGANFEPNQIVYTRWTGILNPDCDGDNLSDAGEITAGTSSSTWDTDNDTLSDADEVITHGTNPLANDGDGDGVWDFIEISLGFDPNDALDFPILPLSWEWLVLSFAGLGSLAATKVMRRTRARL